MSQAGPTPVTIMLPNMAVPSLAVEIIPFGLHITQILLNADGRSHDLLIGPYDNKTHVDQRGFLNCVVGRYCNRLPVGAFEVEKDGEKGIVKTISTESPTVSLHGGPVGFDRLIWTRITAENAINFSPSEKARLSAMDHDALAIFSLTSPSGDQGFPGELYTEVLFVTLTYSSHPLRDSGEIDLGQLAIVYRSRLISQTRVATPINLTQHWGFNLSASVQPPPENPSVNTHSLRINSEGTIELQPDFLATGNITSIQPNGPYDHNGKLIGDKAPAKGYDEFYMFKNDQSGSSQPIHLKLAEWEKGDLLEEIFSESKKEIPVELYSRETGLAVAFQTNQPGVQLYTGEGLDGSGTKKKIHGGSATGKGYIKRAAAFLEFHEPHAAWLHPWGAKGSSILSTKEIYHNYTKAIFSIRRSRGASRA